MSRPGSRFSLGSAGGTLRRIAVAPPAAFGARPRLWTALEQRFPVTFVAADEAVSRECAAQLRFSDGATAQNGHVPTLSFPSAELETRLAALDLTAVPALDARLRGRRLSSPWTPTLSIPAAAVLAETDGGRNPVWFDTTADGVTHQVVAAPLPELGAHEVLRDRLSPGSSLAGIALFHFLREVCAGLLPTPPPLRASIIVDDPNLRWRTYGKLDYREVVSHAAVADYHLAVATIPLDLRIAHGPTVRLFRDHADRISLAVHGNNHARRELADTRPPADMARLVAQAIRRVRAFEERTGLAVSRVMAPPHEACGREAMRQLVRAGFESATLSRAFSWVPVEQITSPYADPDLPAHAAGFEPAEVLSNGLPAMIRRDFGSLEDVLTMAFLDQPVLLYGHEPEFGDHLGLIESVAAKVNGLGDVHWCDLQTISRSNYSTWHGDPHTLHVQPFARRIHVRVPAGVSTLVVEALVTQPEAATSEPLEHGGSAELALGDRARHTVSLQPEAGEQRVEIAFVATDAVEPETVASPQFHPGVVLRRIATEARDRLHTLS